MGDRRTQKYLWSNGTIKDLRSMRQSKILKSLPSNFSNTGTGVPKNPTLDWNISYRCRKQWSEKQAIATSTKLFAL